MIKAAWKESIKQIQIPTLQPDNNAGSQSTSHYSKFSRNGLSVYCFEFVYS